CQHKYSCYSGKIFKCVASQPLSSVAGRDGGALESCLPAPQPSSSATPFGSRGSNMSISPSSPQALNPRPQLRLVPIPASLARPIGSAPVPDRVDVFLDMGYVIRSARTAFGWRVGSRTPDPLTTAREILALRCWPSELGT